MSHQDPLIGRVIGGRYRLEERLGEGGFGEVYKATHLVLGTPVAVKLTRQDRPDLLARFRREALAQERLEVRFVVRVRDFGREPDGLHYLVQSFVDGPTLLDVINRRGVVEPARAVELCRQICIALEEAHLSGIIHRDIKPANIMVVDTLRGEEIRLLDFGIAKLVDAASGGLTQTGQVFGTVAYMAPEQVQGKDPLPQTDLYAVGGVLFHALVGRYPYLGDIRSVAMQHLLAPPPELPGHLPDVLSRVFERAMAKEPADRFADARAMAQALADCLPEVRHLPPDFGEATAVERMPTDMLVASRRTVDHASALDDPTANALRTSTQQSWRGELAADAPDDTHLPAERGGWLTMGRRWMVAAGLVALLVVVLTALLAGPDERNPRSADDESTAGALSATGSAPPAATDPQVALAPSADRAGVAEAATPDAATPDAATPDAATPDASIADAAAPDPEQDPDAAPVTAAPARKRVRRTRSRTTPRAPKPPAAKPSPEKTAAASKGQQLHDAIGRFEVAMKSCKCKEAYTALRAVARLREDAAVSRRSTYNKKCKVVGLPGSCL